MSAVVRRQGLVFIFSFTVVQHIKYWKSSKSKHIMKTKSEFCLKCHHFCAPLRFNLKHIRQRITNCVKIQKIKSLIEISF